MSMFLRSTTRLTTRAFSTSRAVFNAGAKPVAFKTSTKLADVDGPETLIGPGAQPGTFPTDLDQATGLARLELLAKLEGIEVFENRPLDSSRIGTMEDPIIVESFDDYRYVGCTGSPADSHEVQWLKPTIGEVARCWECGSVYKLKPLGIPQDDHH